MFITCGRSNPWVSEIKPIRPVFSRRRRSWLKSMWPAVMCGGSA